ncbi:MAG: hypothetical protein AVDCRST_MAG37-2466, partial [uncultured Rubrobacteraceae bacterium]
VALRRMRDPWPRRRYRLRSARPGVDLRRGSSLSGDDQGGCFTGTGRPPRLPREPRSRDRGAARVDRRARDVAPARRQSYASRGSGRLRAVACGIGDKHYRRSTPGVAFGTRARRRGVARCRCPGRRTPGGVLLCGFAHGGVVGYRDRYACRTPATRSRCTVRLVHDRAHEASATGVGSGGDQRGVARTGRQARLRSRGRADRLPSAAQL